MSKYCKACILKERLKKSNPDEYAAWRNAHIYRFNYSGSAPGMETKGAQRIFGRSVQKHKFRFTRLMNEL